jgi:hypothetical protein
MGRCPVIPLVCMLKYVRYQVPCAWAWAIAIDIMGRCLVIPLVCVLKYVSYQGPWAWAIATNIETGNLEARIRCCLAQSQLCAYGF